MADDASSTAAAVAQSVRDAAYAKMDASAGASHAAVELAQAAARMHTAAEYAMKGSWFWAHKSAKDAADCLADQGGIQNKLEFLCDALLKLSCVAGPGPGQEWMPGTEPGKGPILTNLGMKADAGSGGAPVHETREDERRRDIGALNALEKRIAAVQKDADRHFAGQAARLNDHEDRINALGALCETLTKADRDLWDAADSRLKKIEDWLVKFELRTGFGTRPPHAPNAPQAPPAPRPQRE